MRINTRFLPYSSLLDCKRGISSLFAHPSSAFTENLHLHAKGTRGTLPLPIYCCRRSNSYSRHERSSHDHAVWIRIRDASEVCDVVLPRLTHRGYETFRCAPRPDNTFPSNFETSVRKKGGRRDARSPSNVIFFSQSIRDYYLANCFQMEV